jgi:hypothetical protein
VKNAKRKVKNYKIIHNFSFEKLVFLLVFHLDFLKFFVEAAGRRSLGSQKIDKSNKVQRTVL